MAKRATVCGVQVHTWGTSYGGGKGVWTHLKSILYASGIEHAALSLSIPDNDVGMRLISRYCVDENGDEIIPYERREIKFADGRVENTLIIYFSSWSATGSFHLNLDPNEDKNYMYPFSDFEYDQKYSDMFTSSQNKIVKGLLGKKTISPGPAVIAHNVGSDKITKKQFDVISRLTDNVNISHHLSSLRKLLKKLKESNDENLFVLSDSNRLLLTNMLGDYKYISAELLNKKTLDQYDLDEIISITSDEIEDYEEKLLKNTKEINNKFPNEQDIYDIDKKHLVYGPVESGLVSLPISNMLDEDVGVNNGLDVEAMMHQMHTLAINRVVMDLDSNCSEMVAQILEAGIQQQHLKFIMSKRAIFRFNTPQMLYNASLMVQQGIINNEQTNIWHKMQFFNPAAPIEKKIQSLIIFVLNKNYSLIDIAVFFGIITLLVPLVVIKAIVWPFNIFGGFLAKALRVKIVKRDNADADIAKTGLSENGLHERNVIDRELKSEIDQNLKIKQINIINPEAAILHFAIALSNPESIPVFTNSDVDKLKTYITQRDTTPEELKNSIVALALPLPENLDYNNLSDLLDELQLLSAQRVTAGVKQLYDIIKNRKRTNTQFEEGRDSTTTSSDISNDDNTPIANQKKRLDDM